ncbi:MAG: hypothetical protein LLG08_05370 [Actinomycetia bacterium]|nr:hypothetical protein [Actinomycetes bacterium]
MTEQLSFGRVLAVLRQQWWLIVTVVAVAAGTGYLASLKTTDVYTGVANIKIDTAPSARYRGMPLADDLVKAISDAEIRAAVAKSLGVDEATVAATLGAAASGNPLTRIRVTYAAGTKDAAEAGARAGAEQLIAVVETSMAKEVAIREAQIAASEKAVAAIDAVSKSQPLTSEAAFERWSIEMQLLDYKNTLEGVRGVYTYDGSASSSVSLASSARKKNALGGAVVGLALGILLAGAREAVRPRA